MSYKSVHERVWTKTSCLILRCPKNVFARLMNDRDSISLKLWRNCHFLSFLRQKALECTFHYPIQMELDQCKMINLLRHKNAIDTFIFGVNSFLFYKGYMLDYCLHLQSAFCPYNLPCLRTNLKQKD